MDPVTSLLKQLDMNPADAEFKVSLRDYLLNKENVFEEFLKKSTTAANFEKMLTYLAVWLDADEYAKITYMLNKIGIREMRASVNIFMENVEDPNIRTVYIDSIDDSAKILVLNEYPQITSEYFAFNLSRKNHAPLEKFLRAIVINESSVIPESLGVLLLGNPKLLEIKLINDLFTRLSGEKIK